MCWGDGTGAGTDADVHPSAATASALVTAIANEVTISFDATLPARPSTGNRAAPRDRVRSLLAKNGDPASAACLTQVPRCV